jgi:hypothetical protein
MSGFDWNNKNSGTYRGIPDALGEEAPIPAQFKNLPQAAPAAQYQQLENLIETEEDEEYYNNLVLSDARLRLVQGSLYERIMNHNIFEGYDADPIAIKNVDREIKKYARERMEIMLGMRQEKPVQTQPVQSPFADLEISILKALVSKGTGGVSSSPELNKISSSGSQKLNTIQGPAKQALQPLAPPQKATPRQQTPVAPPAVAQPQEARLPDELPTKLLEEMNDQEREAYLERNRQRYAKKPQAPANGMPMPDPMSERMAYTNQSAQMSRMLSPSDQTLLDHVIKQR